MPVHPKIIQRKEYQVGTYDIDSQKRLTIPGMTKMMHEAAMQNVIDLKLSYWDLIPFRISWVIMRKKMEIFRQPTLGEKIMVETHPAGFEKLFTYRDFKIYDEQGERIAQASSTWLLMDTEKRSIAPIPEFVLKHEMPDMEFLPKPERKIPLVKSPGFSKENAVGWFELDWNGHLNNIHYITKMLDTLPREIHEGKSLKRLDLVYKLECKYGERLTAETQKGEEGTFIHRIVNGETGKEVTQGRSYWT